MNEMLLNLVDPLHQWLVGLGDIGVVLWIIAKILVIAVPVIIAVAFYVVWERKLIGWMHVRHGPMYVGMGIFQAFADVFKLLFKEIVQPTNTHKALFVIAPLITLAPAFAAWAVVPFDAKLVLSNANVGLLYLLAMTSLGVYGIILAGWASNSKYAFLGAMRSAAQVVSYEIAMGFALVGVMIAAQSVNLSAIVMAQAGNSGFFDWFLVPLFPLFIVYWVSGVAETNRAPVRRGGRRVGNRRRPHGRVLGRCVCAVLPGRIRQHDPGQLPDLDLLPRRLAEPDPGLGHGRCVAVGQLAVDRRLAVAAASNT